MRCCHIPCGNSPIDYAVNISNKLLLDIRRHVKKYYSVSISLFVFQFASVNEVFTALVNTTSAVDKALLYTYVTSHIHPCSSPPPAGPQMDF